ncbi:MAG: class I SAM-dependent methyltransferase [Planctomycetota bacterium]
MQMLCPILGRPTHVRFTGFQSGPWRIVQCLETGFVFLADPPTYDQLQVEHAWEVTSAAEKQRRREAEPWLAVLSLAAARLKLRLFPRRNRFFDLSLPLCDRVPAGEPLRVLDIGCAAADLLHDLHGRFAAMGRRMVPYGIEVSAHLAKLADAECAALGGRVEFASALEGSARFAAGSVDLVIMSSFLEHEAQPLALLKTLAPALSPHALIVLKVPNFGCINRRIRGSRWCGFRYPDHVNYFTPATLHRLAAEAGFVVARQRLTDCLPTSDTMYAVFERAPAMAGGLTTERSGDTGGRSGIRRAA